MRGIVIALVLALAAVARAESPAEVEAKQHYKDGQKALEAARWAEALDAFQKSWELSRYPALIYKIALCQDQLGRSAEALASYRRYLTEDPQTQRRAGVEERIATLTQLLEAPKPQPKSEPKPEPKPTVVVSAEPHRTPLYKKWWLWTIVGVVVVGAGVGVGLGLGLTQGRISRPYDWTPDFTLGLQQASVSF